METINTTHVKKILLTGFFMAIGLLAFKYYPMYLYGENILFDASMHITVTFFVLYIIWFFIPKEKRSWRIPFYIFSATMLIIISIQRIFALAHDEWGILLGFSVSLISIFLSEKLLKS